jgi:hypothetical protein
MGFVVPSAWQPPTRIYAGESVQSLDLEYLIDNDRITRANCMRTHCSIAGTYTTTQAISTAWTLFADRIPVRTSIASTVRVNYVVRLKASENTASVQLTLTDGTNTDSTTISTAGAGSTETLTGTWTTAGTPGNVWAADSTLFLKIEWGINTAGTATLYGVTVTEDELTASDF